MSEKMKEMIDKLKKLSVKKEEAKEKPVQAPAPAEVVEEVPEQAEEPKPVPTPELPKEPPQDDGTLAPPVEQPVQAETPMSEEQTQQLIARRISELHNNGAFRLELLGELRQLTESVNLLCEVVAKAAELDKK